jgi:uncharacterized protein YndB with AHSA1/START domain
MFKRIAIVLVLTALILVGLTVVLPAERNIERSRDIKAAPEKIWPLLAAPKQWVLWQPWYRKDPAMEIRYSGPESGVSARSSWRSKSEGSGSMRLSVVERPRFLGYELSLENTATTAQGEFRLVPIAGGTRVTWVVQFKPFLPLRWLALLLDRSIGPDLEAGLVNLEQAANR